MKNSTWLSHLNSKYMLLTLYGMTSYVIYYMTWTSATTTHRHPRTVASNCSLSEQNIELLQIVVWILLKWMLFAITLITPRQTQMNCCWPLRWWLECSFWSLTISELSLTSQMAPKVSLQTPFYIQQNHCCLKPSQLLNFITSLSSSWWCWNGHVPLVLVLRMRLSFLSLPSKCQSGYISCRTQKMWYGPLHKSNFQWQLHMPSWIIIHKVRQSLQSSSTLLPLQ